MQAPLSAFAAGLFAGRDKLPDPAILFALLLALVWLRSWLMPDRVLTARIATIFLTFAPLGVARVAMLGIGSAHTYPAAG